MNSNSSNTVLSNDEIREILVRRINQQKQATGIVVGVVEPNGRRVVAHGNFASGDPRAVEGDTIFEIGSISKVFTSLLLADMVNRGEVALDDPAAKYVPEHVKVPERGGKAITLLDLSTHMSGLPVVPSNLKPKDTANPYGGYSVDDLYAFLSRYELPRDPGSEFEYSNLGAGLLGHVLARRAGTDYERLIHSRITQPLGMPDTRITLTSSMEQRMATGHNAILTPVSNWDLPTLAGAGALRSCANDMLTFLEAFLGYKESALTRAMKSMLEVHRPIGQAAGNATIGLAWFRLGDSVWHNGGTGGFRSFVGCDPRARGGVVVLSNAFTATGVDDIGGHIGNPKVPLANPEAPGQRTEFPIDPKLLDHYTGRYQLPDRVLEISRDRDRLFLQAFAAQGIGGPKFEIVAESEKSFFSRVTGTQIRFETGPDGRATSLTMHRVGREPTAAARLP